MLPRPPKGYKSNLPSGNRVVTKNQPIIQEKPQSLRKYMKTHQIYSDRDTEVSQEHHSRSQDTYYHIFLIFPFFFPFALLLFFSLSAESVSYKTNFFLFIQLMLKNIILTTECLIYSWACTIPGIICHFFNKTWFTSGTSIFL